MYWLCVIHIFYSCHLCIISNIYNSYVIVYSLQLSRELACFFQYAQMHEWYPLFPPTHHYFEFHQSSSCPISDVISPVSLWWPPPFPAINASLHDVEVEVLEPIEIPKLLQFSLHYSRNQLLLYWQLLHDRVICFLCRTVDRHSPHCSIFFRKTSVCYVRGFPCKGFASIQLQR